jgi:ubiquinone biosynthesis protein COQ9
MSDTADSDGDTHAKRKLLAAMLPHVPFDGWSGAVILRAATESGIDAAMVPRLFPNGPLDAVKFWIAEADRAMLAELGLRDLAAMKVRERVATAVRIRLESQAPHREAVRRALALLALPPNAAAGLTSLYRTVDAIWQVAGDTATDWNFYTKRLLLAGVYGTTLLFWLDDKSEGFAATWAFLERRLADVMRIQKARGALDRLMERLPETFRRRA